MAGDEIEVAAVDLVERELLLSDPKRMDKIYMHLAMGGTLIDYCRLVGQPFAEVKRWIDADADRKSKYEQGKEARKEWLFERVLEEYKALSTFSIAELYDESGALKPVAEWSAAAKAAVSKVESVELTEMVDGEKVPVGEVKKIALWDKTKTLNDMAKYLRMLADVVDVNINGQVSITGALDEAERRVALARSVVASPVVDVEVVEEGAEVDSAVANSAVADEPI